MVLTMLLTEHPRFVEKPRVGVSLKKRIGDTHVGLCIQLFDTLILMEAWLKQELILKKDLKQFRKFIPKLMEHHKSVINRTVGEGLKIQKFHYFRHLTTDIEEKGVLLCHTGHVGESDQKFTMKVTALHVQK